MSVHPDGTGTGWTNVEAVDVDRPHGLDYRYAIHIAKGVRKRINKEHVAFGDTTAGGEHIPGGCAVLDIVDGTDDVTDGWNDGTYTGGGLVYSLCGIMYVCSTLDTTYDGATDVTIVKMHPDLQWAGGDVTWAGAHEFDASVDISGPLDVWGAAEFSAVDISDSLDLTGHLACGSDAAFAGDISVDGTAALQNTVIEGDSTFTFAAIAGETGPIFKIFGDWSARAMDVTYTARTDGLVAVYIRSNGAARIITGATPHGTMRNRFRTNGSIDDYNTFTMGVKGGDTWSVSGDVTTYTDKQVLWLPLGDNT